MDLKETYQQIFQAFSALSDAQELIAMNRLRGANDQINHAKLHLLGVVQADEHGYAEAIRDLPLTCTLEKGGN